MPIVFHRENLLFNSEAGQDLTRKQLMWPPVLLFYEIGSVIIQSPTFAQII